MTKRSPQNLSQNPSQNSLQKPSQNKAPLGSSLPSSQVWKRFAEEMAFHFPRKFIPLVAFAVNALLFGILYALFTPQYNTRDDIGMMLLASGRIIALEPSPYLMFINILLGHVLAGLYAAVPSVSWYAGCLIASLFAAHWSLLAVALKHRASWLTVIVFAVYFWLLGAYMLLSLQFTMVGVMLGVAGVAMIFFYPADTQTDSQTDSHTDAPVDAPADAPTNAQHILSHFLPLIVGAALLVLSCLVRAESFALALALMLPAVVAIWIMKWATKWTIKRETDTTEWRKDLLRRQLPTFAVALIICIAAYFHNAHAYATWGKINVIEQNRLCAQIIDVQIVRRQTTSQKFLDASLERAGWTVSDLEMCVNWYFNDDAVYSIDRLTTFIETYRSFNPQNEPEITQQQNANYQAELTKKLWIRQREAFTSSTALACGMVILLAAAALLRLNLAQALAFSSSVTAFFALGLVINNQTLLRDVPDRIFHPLLAALALLPLLLPTSSARTSSPRTSSLPDAVRLACVGAALLLVAYASYGAAQRYQSSSLESERHSKDLRGITATLNPNPNNLYVIWADGFPLDYIAPFDAPSGGLAWTQSFHAVWFAWCQNMPTSRAVAAAQGVKNVIADMGAKPNVFTLFCMNQIRAQTLAYHNRYGVFIREHYPAYRIMSKTPIRPLQPIPDNDSQLDVYRTYLEVKFNFEPPNAAASTTAPPATLPPTK